MTSASTPPIVRITCFFPGRSARLARPVAPHTCRDRCLVGSNMYKKYCSKTFRSPPVRLTTSLLTKGEIARISKTAKQRVRSSTDCASSWMRCLSNSASPICNSDVCTRSTCDPSAFDKVVDIDEEGTPFVSQTRRRTFNERKSNWSVATDMERTSTHMRNVSEDCICSLFSWRVDNMTNAPAIASINSISRRAP